MISFHRAFAIDDKEKTPAASKAGRALEFKSFRHAEAMFEH